MNSHHFMSTSTNDWTANDHPRNIDDIYQHNLYIAIKKGRMVKVPQQNNFP